MLVNAAGVGIAASTQRSAHPAAAVGVAAQAPWMVSVVHKINLLPVLNSSGIQASTVDGSNAVTYNLTTGIVMDRDGHIMTRLVNVNPNNPSPDITIKTVDGRALSAEILGLDGSTGLTILRVPDLKIDPPTFAEDANLADGDIIHVLSPDFEGTLTHFKARGDNGSADQTVSFFPTMKLLSTTARITRVPSTPRRATRNGTVRVTEGRFTISAPSARRIADDSVVVNRRGQVVGLTLVEQSDAGRTREMVRQANFVYPIGDAKLVAERIIHSRSISKAWLGVSGVSITELSVDEKNAFFSSSQFPSQGIIVSRVEPSSPAAVAGLKPNDILISFNNQDITSTQEFSQILNAAPIGQTMEMVTYRDGKTVKVDVKLAQRPFVVVQQTATANPNRSALELQDLKYRITILENEFAFQQQRLALITDQEARQTMETKLRQIKELLEIQKSALSQLEASNAAAAAQSSTTPPPPKPVVPNFSLQIQLGIAARELSDQLRVFFGVPDHQGILIETVKAGGLADQAGLKAGDVLMELNGVAITNAAIYQRLLNTVKYGDKLKAMIIRDKARKEITINIPEVHSRLMIIPNRLANLTCIL